MDFNDQPESRQHTRTSAQSTRVLYRRKNFFVLAPSHQDVPRLEREEADLDGHSALPREPAVSVAVLDAPTRSEDDHPATLQRASAWTVPVWLETILVFVGLGASFASHAINLFNYPHYEQDEGTYLMYAWASPTVALPTIPMATGTPRWPGSSWLPGCS